MEELVSVAEFDSLAQAHIYRSRLESEGIACFLSNESMNSLYPGMAFTKVELKVRLSDSLRAVDILFENPSDDPIKL